MMNSVTRRSALFGAAASAVALAVPAAAAVKPSFPPELEATVDRWNRTQDAKALAWQAYEATFRGLTREQVVPGAEEAARRAWLAACEEADLAQFAMMRLLRVTYLDLKAIYRRA